ncbi:hypothetical protein [Massilia sp. Root133]|uniref:hypothetical protein n=1 Tax=Massilia sp. Root133 TaxID=1736455 RepID=UPI0012E83E68|nr:hypothetical protein [Massilia sp. Root133]
MTYQKLKEARKLLLRTLCAHTSLLSLQQMAGSKYSRTAEKDHAKVSTEKLRVSFEYLDLSLPHFFIHGLEAEHYRKIFDCIHEITDSTEDQIVQQKHPSLEAKSIFNKGGEYKRFPEDIEQRIFQKISGIQKRAAESENDGAKVEEDAYVMARAQAESQAKSIVSRAFEVRVGKAYGRIHGIVWDKVFYVVWFDPAHNLYPDDRFGGVRFHKDFARVKGFSPEDVTNLREVHLEHCNQIQAELEKLQADNDELMETFASMPSQEVKQV